MCMNILLICIWFTMYVLSTWEGHKRVSDPLELKIRMAVSHSWCAGIWTQVPCNNNHWAISLQTQDSFMLFATGWNTQKARENYPIVIQDHTETFFSSLCFELQYHILLLTLLFSSLFWNRSSLCYPGWSQIQSTWIFKCRKYQCVTAFYSPTFAVNCSMAALPHCSSLTLFHIFFNCSISYY